MSLIEYTDDAEPVSLAEVKAQSRVTHYAEDDLIELVIIPAARALAEQKTGCAIREARYAETVPDTSRLPLSMGGVLEVESVKLGSEDVAYDTLLEARRTYVSAPAGAVVTYKAGTNIANHPGVKSWILLVCAWMYANRELIGDSKMEPPYFTQTLLSSIAVPSGF
ncbi:MAG: hypothetical protein BGO66_17630 [Alicycliphilus sp. 69-12]|mgnify:CR=1 FL=1|jgi:hypothetical protein|nr:MAG: hypothetical protein BGO66_17630 [Alicycliphilus sp. 69-12]